MKTELPLFNKYCVDSCVLIDLWHRLYPPVTFPSLWTNFNKLIEVGEIISTIEVYNELEPQADELSVWIKQHKSMFIDLDQDQIKILRDIYNKFPDMVSKGSKTGADAFLVALAKVKVLTVITSEQKVTNPSPKDPKVPNLCEMYGVTCINLVEFFKEKNWKF